MSNRRILPFGAPLTEEQFRRNCGLDKAVIAAEVKRMKRMRWFEYVLWTAIIAWGLYLSPWVQQYVA